MTDRSGALPPVWESAFWELALVVADEPKGAIQVRVRSYRFAVRQSELNLLGQSCVGAHRQPNRKRNPLPPLPETFHGHRKQGVCRVLPPVARGSPP